MNKHILADIVTEKLKREIGMAARPLPEELTPLEKVLPSGKQRYGCALYQAEKLKKLSMTRCSILRNSFSTFSWISIERQYRSRMPREEDKWMPSGRSSTSTYWRRTLTV